MRFLGAAFGETHDISGTLTSTDSLYNTLGGLEWQRQRVMRAHPSQPALTEQGDVISQFDESGRRFSRRNPGFNDLPLRQAPFSRGSTGAHRFHAQHTTSHLFTQCARRHRAQARQAVGNARALNRDACPRRELVQGKFAPRCPSSPARNAIAVDQPMCGHELVFVGRRTSCMSYRRSP